MYLCQNGTVTEARGRTQAVVIGAGIAGLSLAAAVAGRFDQVVLVDRDLLPDSPTPRRGVPQSYHGHVLLAAGQRALEELFPGLGDELVRAGAIPFDPGVELGFYRYGALWPRVPSGLQIVALTRPLLELTIRQRVAALPNVRLRAPVAVSALTGDDTRVTGVVLDDGEVVPADLVVDCSGRGSRSDRWLGALGLPTPSVVEVKVGVGYATRLFHRTPDALADGVGMLVMPTPPDQKRVGLSLAVEGDRWLVGLGGWHGDHPPHDPDGFRRHARSLPDPTIADLLDHAEPLTDIAPFQFPSSRRRRFERLPRPPARYPAAGDSTCRFSPLYGPGRARAARAAGALRRALGRDPGMSSRMARAVYRGAAPVLATPWQVSG